jgi:CSLREA domain-containing protein
MKHRRERQLLICTLGVLLLSAGIVNFTRLGAQAATQGRAIAAKLGLRAAALATTSRRATAVKATTPLAVFATFTVNNLGDAADANPGNGACATSGSVCTLRAAVQEANALGGTDMINISVTGTITLSSALPDLSGDVTINGPGASSLTISGNNSVRPFLINGGVTVTISNLTIAQGRTTAQGGAIESSGTLTLTNCVLSNNQATFDGGAVRNNGGSLTVTNCTFSNNRTTDATAQGGAIKHNGSFLSVTGTTFVGNQTSAGGGLHVASSATNTTISNSTFYNNSANFGGGMETRNGATIRNCTISGNRAGSGGGLLVSNQPATLLNNIIAGNTDSGGSTQSDVGLGGAGSIDTASSFNNLIGTGGSGGLTNGTNGNQVGVADAGLAPFGNHGGPTQTFALLSTSPAIDKGRSIAGITTDQRGAPRPFDLSSVSNASGGSGEDIGAFEYMVRTVTKLADTNDGVCDASDCSLREAITAANAGTGGDNILFQSGLTGTIVLSNPLPTLTKSLTITGPGPKASNLIIQGNNTFLLMKANGGGINLTLNLLSFTQGRPNASNAGALEFTDAGVLSVTDSEFFNNQGIQTNGDFVIYSSNSTGVTLNRCTVRNNATSGIKNDLAPLTVTTSTFSDNNGTAIYNISQGTSISNSTITNHIVGIWNDSSVQPVSATVTNNLLSNNGNFNLRKAPTTFPNTFTSGGYNLIDDDKGNVFLNNLGPGDILNQGSAQAGLVAIADNGGPTQTRALLTGSQAIDAGGTASTPGADQRGLTRPFNTARDIGAFECVIDMTPTSLPSGIQNMAYSSTTLTGSNGTTSYTFAITSGSLPMGLSLSSAGLLSGTPTQTGSFPLVITMTDANGFTGSRRYTLTISAGTAPSITSANNTTFTVGTAGSFTVTATGSPAPTLSQSGTLPSGITFNTGTGVLSGTPAAGTGGTYNLTLTANNGVNPNATQNFTLTVNQAPAITSANNTTFTVGTAGSFTMTKTGFPVPSLSQSGTLPNGVTFNTSTGVLSGTPAAGTGGTYNLSFTASNGVNPNATQNFTLTVNTPPTISAVAVSRQQGNQPTNLQIATVLDAEDAEESLTVTIAGGASATNNEVTINNLTVNATGQVRADVTLTCTAQNASFTLAVTDSRGAMANATLNVTVPANTAPAVGNYPNSTVVTGGTLTITPDFPPTDNNTVVSVMATAAPASFTGSFSGNTSSGGVTVMNANPAGSYTITVTLTDNCGATTTRSFMLTVSACGAVLSKQRELFAANGSTDSFTVTIDAGCNWAATSDNPDWITVTAPVGNFAGAGTVSYSVAVNNSSARRTGSITVAGQTYRVWQSAQFGDVPLSHPFYDFIGKLSALGITLGCGNGNYCPDANTTREQMAIFIERALGVFNPPVPNQQTFQDVPPTLVGYPFIEDFVARGITTGCAAGPPRLYCPTAGVTREQVAIFILRGLGVFTPPAGPQTPTFADVPNSGVTDYSYEFIEEFVRRGITSGCGTGPLRYCPTAPVTRGQMAVFLVRAFGT